MVNSSACAGKTSTSTGHRCHPPNIAAHQHSPPHHVAHQDSGLRAPHRPPRPLPSGAEARHEEQQRDRDTAGAEWQHNGYVLTTPQGRAIDPTTLTRTFTTLLRKAGRPPPHPLPRPPALHRHPAAGTGRRTCRDQGTPRPRPLRSHRHRLRPRKAPPPAKRDRHPRCRPRRPGDRQEGQYRRRTAVLRPSRPLTLPSTTAVTPRRSPTRTHLAGLHLRC